MWYNKASSYKLFDNYIRITKYILPGYKIKQSSVVKNKGYQSGKNAKYLFNVYKKYNVFENNIK